MMTAVSLALACVVRAREHLDLRPDIARTVARKAKLARSISRWAASLRLPCIIQAPLGIGLDTKLKYFIRRQKAPALVPSACAARKPDGSAPAAPNFRS
jgi:hypothetical protein